MKILCFVLRTWDYPKPQILNPKLRVEGLWLRVGAYDILVLVKKFAAGIKG